MFEVFTHLFDPTGFPPRRECGDGWTSELIWLHIVSDLFIWLAYVSIPLVLLYFTRRRDLPFPRLFLLFALFILACGTTHLIEALIFDYPVYRLAGVVKFITAVVSWMTVFALIPVIPRVMNAVNEAAKPGDATKLHRPLPPARKASRIREYIVAILAAILAILLRAAINPLLKNDYVFVLALLAVVYVSWQYGFWPGIVCLLVSVVGYTYLFIPPRYTFFVSDLGTIMTIGLFFFCGVACAALGESHRAAQRRASVALGSSMSRQEELESEVVRRRVVEAALRQREADLVAAQRASAESLTRLNAFLDNAPVGIAFFDPDLRYVRINPYLAAANGKPIAAHTGRTLSEIIPDFPPEVLEAYKRTAAVGGKQFTTQIRRPDRLDPNGTRVWQVTAFPVREAESRPVGAGVFVQDVTDRLKAEEIVEQSERRYRSLVIATAQTVWNTDPDGLVTEDSATWRAYTGQTLQQYEGWGWLDAVHPDDRSRAEAAWRGAVESRSRYSVEYRLRRHDGEYRWSLARGVPVLESDGRIREWIGTCTDIHEEKSASDRAEEANLFLEATIDALSSHIAVLDQNGVILKVNQAWRQFGENNGLQARGHGVGSDYLAVCDVACPSNPPARLSDGIKAVITGKEQAYRAEYPCHSPTERRWFQMRVNRFPGEGPVSVVVAHEDISVRVAAEEAVRESEARFRSMADSVPALIWLSELDGRRTYFNKTWLEFTGRSESQEFAFGWTQDIHPEDRDLYLNAYNGAFAERQPFELEYRLRRHDGEYRGVLARGTPRITPSGEFAGFVGLCLDVTEQREANEAIRQSANFRRSVFENSPDCLKIFDLDGRLLEMNQAGCRLMELDDFDSIKGSHWADLWPAANRETVREAVGIARAGEVGRFQGFCPTAKGTAKYWDASVASLPGVDGSPYRLIGISRDITEHRRAEERIRESELRFRTLTEAVPQIVWTANPQGELTFVNRRWDEYTCMPIKADVWGGLVHPDDLADFLAAWTQALSEKPEAFVHEFRLRRAADGAYRWMLTVAVSLNDATGALVEWVGTLTDIDDQKRHTQILEGLVRERTAELQRSNEELEKFAYIASHDLQEPLRKIQAFGDRLRTKCRDEVSDNGKEYIDRMHSAAARMRRLIDDLLSFSRVTTQQRPYTRVDLHKLANDVLSDMDLRLNQTAATVHVGNLPTIDADPTQMRQLFQNLLVNAVKFHRPGVPPVVEVEGETFDQVVDGSDSSQSISMCRLTVRDNGIGFDEKYRDRIFDVFQRLHGRNQYEGTGVGLAICRKIVERHGGTITATGKEGEGATFIVVLPLRQNHTREVSNEDVQQEQTDHDPAGRRRPG